MSRGRIWLSGFAVFIGIVLLGVWQVPGWLDWTRYRTTIEVLASATLGEPVTIQGPIALKLLPQPVLTAEHVTVGSGDPSGVSIRMEALRLRVALWPLIGGRVDARELILHGADLRIPWPSQTGVLNAASPAWLTAFSARIEDGRLTIGRLSFTGIEASLQTVETGALAAAGTAKFTDQDWHFTARLTAAGPDGAAGLNVTLDGQGKAGGLGASFTGQLLADGSLAGAVTSRGPNLAVLLPAPPVPFRADGRLTIGNGLMLADDLALEIGGSPATAAVALRVAPQQRLDVALAASRLDLDAWLPVLLRSAATVAGVNLPIGMDLSAQAAPFGGGTLQHLRAAFELSNGGVLLREASALLPGNAALSLAGRMSRGDPAQARFEGDARLEAPVLRNTLRWLGEATPGVLPSGLPAGLPAGTLQRAALSAHVVAGLGEIQASRIVGAVDDTTVTGSIGVKRGEPPAMKADLTLERLRLDPWLPVRLPGIADVTRFAAGADAELRINVRNASLAGVPLQEFGLDAAIEAGSLTLRRLDATGEGVRIVASGMVGETGRVSDATLSLTTDDATRVAEWVPLAWRATPALWHGPASLTIDASGVPEALGTRIRLSMADARLEAQPTIDLIAGQWSGSLAVHHPGARRLLATLGLPERLGVPGLPAWIGDGSLSLMAQLASSPGRFAANFDLTAAALRANGKLVLAAGGDQPKLTGRLAIEALPVPLPGGASEVPLPLAALRGWQADLRVEVARLLAGFRPILRDAAASVTLANGTLRIDQLTAKLGGGALTGFAVFDSAANPPALTLQAQVTGAAADTPLEEAPLDLLSGRLNGSIEAAGMGYSPSAIMATLTGRLSAGVTDGVVSGFDLYRVKQAALVADRAAAADALTSGVTGFERLDLAGHFGHGDFSIDGGRLVAAAGTAELSGSVGLVNQSLDLRITMHPAVAEPPEIALRLAGTMARPNRTLELSGLARWLAEHAP